MAVEERCPDLILMDLQMPVMDGYTATRHLRANPAYRNLPIIALSANALRDEHEKCLAAGMNAHVTKPVRMDILFDQMTKFLPERFHGGHDGKSAPAADAPQAGHPALPGIDVAVGLSYVKKTELYRRLLAKFSNTYGRTFASDYAAAIAADD